MTWKLDITKEYTGDKVKMTFSLKQDDAEVTSWVKTVLLNEENACKETFTQKAREYMSNYNKTVTEEVILE